MIRDKATISAVIKENVERVCELIHGQAGKQSFLQQSKVVVLPEGFAQGFPSGTHFARIYDIDFGKDGLLKYCEEVCVPVPGYVTDMLAQVAVEEDLYISAAVFEVDDAWPGRFFNCAFIIDPRGEVILKYRKHCTSLTDPEDVYSEYVKKAGGIKGLFPVVDTPIGKLASFICCDITIEAVARALVLNGAEVLLRSTGEPSGGVPETWDALLRARAYDNMAYVASCNYGGFRDSLRAELNSKVCTQIIDYLGNVLARVEGPGETAISSMVDINALRRERLGSAFFIMALRTATVVSQLYTDLFSKMGLDYWAEKPMKDLAEYTAMLTQVSSNLLNLGILQRADKTVKPVGQPIV